MPRLQPQTATMLATRYRNLAAILSNHGHTEDVQTLGNVVGALACGLVRGPQLGAARRIYRGALRKGLIEKPASE